MCKNCNKRESCRKLCGKVELILSQLQPSIKSNYIVKFVDPHILEALHSKSAWSKKNTPFKNYFSLIKSCLRILNPLERTSLILYYGLDGNPYLSQRKIALIIHVSQHTVSYYLRKARMQIKRFIISNPKYLNLINR